MERTGSRLAPFWFPDGALVTFRDLSMDYLEKLKVYGDQVKNVVVKSMFDTACGGQKILKDVLPGNLVTREYEVIVTSNDESSIHDDVHVFSLQLIQPLGSAGPGLLWHIYGAIKRTTKQVESVISSSPDFQWSVRSRKQLCSYWRNVFWTSMTKRIVISFLRRWEKVLCATLTSRLSLEETIVDFRRSATGEDQTSTDSEFAASAGRVPVCPLSIEMVLTYATLRSRESLAFATESCFGSLANCLGFHDYITPPALREFEAYKLHDVEIRYGIVQVWLIALSSPSIPLFFSPIQLCEGLTFLHNEVRLLHRNITPESIIINTTGAWKLVGFELSVQGSADGVSLARCVRVLSVNRRYYRTLWICLVDLSISRLRSQPPIGYQSTTQLHGTWVLHEKVLRYAVRYVLAGNADLCHIQSWPHVIPVSRQLLPPDEDRGRSSSADEWHIVRLTWWSAGTREDVAQP